MKHQYTIDEIGMLFYQTNHLTKCGLNLYVYMKMKEVVGGTTTQFQVESLIKYDHLEKHRL